MSRFETSSSLSPLVVTPSIPAILSPGWTPPCLAGEPLKVAVTTTVPIWSWMFIPSPA